jgi:hypothetical protein
VLVCKGHIGTGEERAGQRTESELPPHCRSLPRSVTERANSPALTRENKLTISSGIEGRSSIEEATLFGGTAGHSPEDGAGVALRARRSSCGAGAATASLTASLLDTRNPSSEGKTRPAPPPRRRPLSAVYAASCAAVETRLSLAEKGTVRSRCSSGLNLAPHPSISYGVKRLFWLEVLM